MANETQPRWDRRMQQRLARGEAAALGELYDRFAPLVHSLAHRVLDDETAADRVTREVFASIWEEPHAYDPQRGPMRSYIAGLTQETATARLRRRHGAVTAGPGGGAGATGGAGAGEAAGADAAEAERRREQIEEKVRAASTAARADYIVTSMPSSLRAALEITYFQRRDYRDAARELGVTEDEARRRLRLGLQLLSSARSHPLPGQPPGTGRRL